MLIRALFLVLISYSLSAFAAPVPKLGSGEALPSEELSLFDDRYRIGDEWGKVPVTEDRMSKSPVFERASKATAKVGGGTGFYLGKFEGVHIVATNNHVCPRSNSCSWGSIRFTKLGKSYRPKGLIGTWTDIDLALLKIEVSENDQELAAVARNFSFNAPIYPGQKLLTVGFGTANNRSREMVMNADSDCKTFSARNEFRKMADPDSLNRGENQVWSFSNGCDVSHGDSGSAMVDRETGDVVGIIWTGKIPKEARVRNSRYLDEIMETRSEEIWTELSYAVPAAKMREHLIQQLNAGKIKAEDRPAMKKLLGL